MAETRLARKGLGGRLKQSAALGHVGTEDVPTDLNQRLTLGFTQGERKQEPDPRADHQADKCEPVVGRLVNPRASLHCSVPAQVKHPADDGLQDGTRTHRHTVDQA